ncbi:MAG: DNA topoisomerase 3 [Porphyromonas sp.]|nr:DNA topoisomerase 3 [Porphyromonas sp.]
MKLCIAEKPSVARQIAVILGAGASREGYLEGNGYCVTWTFGHLCELKAPGDYTPAWRSWSLVHLPMIPRKFEIKLKSDAGIVKQFGIIKKLMEECDEVINCGDAGQEGELIQRWVMQLAGNTKPVKRLWLSSMTDEAIKEAFSHLKDGSEYNLLYYAGMTRAAGDWLLGMNATRLFTVKYRPGQYGQPLSIGRVQTPTLALIVNREEEIEHFVPEPYWEIKTLYRGVVFSSTKGRYATAEEAEEVIRRIKNEELTVTKVTKKKGKEGPPRLFDLTSLQIEANKKHGFSAEETLSLLQSLYEKKLVTYPRVDTTYLPDDVYPKVPGIMNGLYPYAKSLIDPIAHQKIRKTKKVFDDSKVTDHHAIIPTGEPVKGISGSEEVIFDMVMRRFIAAFYPDMLYEQTTAMADIGGIEFKAAGRVVTDEGWRAVFKNDPSPSDEETKEETPDEEREGVMPPFRAKEHGPHVPDLLEKQTRPPRPYTEATLLNAMETAGKLVEDEDLKEALKQKGIGRPSTRAAIIQTLFRRNYIRKERKNLHPTTVGTELIHTIKNPILKDVQLTGEWEYKLRLIEKGEYSPGAFVRELGEMVSALVVEVMRDDGGGALS